MSFRDPYSGSFYAVMCQYLIISGKIFFEKHADLLMQSWLTVYKLSHKTESYWKLSKEISLSHHVSKF